MRRPAIQVTLALLGLFSALPLLAAPGNGERLYSVQKGDKLEAIARQFNTNTRSILALNKMENANHIMVGQRLRIPGPLGPRDAEKELFSFNPGLKKVLDDIVVDAGHWKYIVIHHSAAPQGNARDIDRYHREERHMENGLAYHFVIGNGNRMGDGNIFVGNRWMKQIEGGHLASDDMNKVAIGICLVGNFNETEPTASQMKSLSILTNYLLQRCKLDKDAVKTHHEINVKPTVCPGKNFSRKSFLAHIGE